MLSKLLSDLPIAPEFLKYGWDNHEEYLRDRQYLYHILAGRTNLIVKAKEYSDSYTKARIKTVLHYRDYLITQMIYHSLQSTLYQDSGKQNLTPHAARAFAQLDRNKIWPYLIDTHTDSVDFEYAGHLGSLAFYFIYGNLKGYPVEIYTRLINLFWSLQGLTISQSPAERIQRIKTLLRLDENLDVYTTRAFSQLMSIDPENELYSAVLYARRSGIEVADVSDISNRILFGNYSDESILVLAAAFTPERLEVLRKSILGSLSIAKPSGIRLLFQALVIEGLTKAASIISQLPQQILLTDLNSFLTAYPEYSEQKYNIAKALSTSFDGFKALSRAGYLSNTETNAGAMRSLLIPWLQSSGQTSIPLTEDSRLGDIFNTSNYELISDIRLDDPIDIQDNNYRYIASQTLKGGDLILKASSNIGDNITFTVTEFNGIGVKSEKFFRVFDEVKGTYRIVPENPNTDIKIAEVTP